MKSEEGPRARARAYEGIRYDTTALAFAMYAT